MTLAAPATAVAACGGYEPIVYTDRVPYEWELWEQDAGTGDGGQDATAQASRAASPGAPAGSGATGVGASGVSGAAGLVGAAGVVAERTVFPADSFWNKDVSGEPVDPVGYKYIESIGLDVGLHADFTAPDPARNKPGYGIPYQYVPGSQKKVAVEFRWPDESDAGPYPIPDSPLIEVGSDRHLLMIDQDNWVLYELYDARFEGGKWKAQSGAIFDMKSNKQRPAGWTSADAAGLAVFPGLVRADEVFEKKAIRHALRFTVKTTQRAYVPPASHFASDKKDASLPPMGMWCRLKSSYDISGFSPNVQVILQALKKHGMILADNGSNFFVSGAPDPRWRSDELKELERVKGRDLEVVRTGPLVTTK